MNIKVKLDSFNKIYKEDENITGVVEINSKEALSFNHITAVLTGSYVIKNMKVSPTQTHIIKFYTKKTKIIEKGKLQSETNNSFNLKLLLNSTTDNLLIETYQGVIVSIQVSFNLFLQYDLVINFDDIKLSDPLKIYVFVPNQGVKKELGTKVVPYDFEIKPSSIEKIKIDQNKIPQFLVKCHIDNTNVNVSKEMDGWLNVVECETPIKSIELQFVRNEKVFLNTGDNLTEVSEIQNLQITDGDIIRGSEISLNMLFPRHFCCASIENKVVKLKFDINIIIVLSNGFVITENVPLNCWRQ